MSPPCFGCDIISGRISVLKMVGLPQFVLYFVALPLVLDRTKQLYHSGLSPPPPTPRSKSAAAYHSFSSGVTSQDPMDEADRFEHMERERIMAEDPESTVYYAAKKSAAMSRTQVFPPFSVSL